MVVWLFLPVSWVCLQFVIVVFPEHTHYFCAELVLTSVDIVLTSIEIVLTCVKFVLTSLGIFLTCMKLVLT